MASSGFGFSDKDTSPLIRAREEVYLAIFGDKVTVSHELQPLVPHIDVYLYPPGYDGRDFFTAITGGMSDLAMNSPAGVDCKRAELALYTKKAIDEKSIELLRWLAHLIHDQQTWMSPGSTMTNGQPPQPIFPGSSLDCFLFLNSIVQPDNSLPERLILEGDPVELLWLVPITSAECEFIRSRDLNDFYDLLQQNGHPHTLEEKRKCYVKSRRG